jgi:hypothetical protein
MLLVMPSDALRDFEQEISETVASSEEPKPKEVKKPAQTAEASSKRPYEEVDEQEWVWCCCISIYLL